jgi:cold shock CspA family protein
MDLEGLGPESQLDVFAKISAIEAERARRENERIEREKRERDRGQHPPQHRRKR